jgi:hypothetical protein
MVRHIQAIVVLICLTTLSGCSVESGHIAADQILTENEVKDALRQLPYDLHFRNVPLPENARGAVAGRATASNGTFLNFGIALGSMPAGVPVPNAQTSESYAYPPGNFLFTDDLQVRTKEGRLVPGYQFKTLRQWRQAGFMEVQITTALCKAATGDVCQL